jgi:hypothetical protein
MLRAERLRRGLDGVVGGRRLDHAPEKTDELLQRRRTRLDAHARLLRIGGDLGEVLTDDRRHQVALRLEVPVQRAHRDPGRRGDFVHPNVGPVGRDLFARRIEDPGAVPDRVGTRCSTSGHGTFRRGLAYTNMNGRSC